MLNRGSRGIFSDDSVSIQLDTFHDQRRAYAFGSNAFGVQADAIWFENSQSFDHSFDTVFETEGRITKEGYIVFFAIPFRSLRFSSDSEQTWGILLTRDIPNADEATFWPRYSSRIQGRLNQIGILRGLRNISPGRNIQVIPYSAFRSIQALDQQNSTDLTGGIDTKLIIRDSLVIDVTVNPDFSQVSSDEPQTTVNQRFEVLFDEKRPFFLENASFFQTPIHLLFTRRITDPQFGIRVSGKIGRYSIGALLADNEAPAQNLTDGEHSNFQILRISRDIAEQSAIGLIYTGREAPNNLNRVWGLDGRFKLHGNWVATFQGVASSTEPQDQNQKGTAYKVNFLRSGRLFNYNAEYNDVSPGFLSLPGFVNRVDIRAFDQQIAYSFRPEGKHLFAWTPHWDSSYIYDHNSTRLDWSHYPRISLELAGRTFVEMGYKFSRIRLRPSDFPALAQNLDFSTYYYAVSFTSEVFKLVSINASATLGTSVNFVPGPGRLPSLADSISGVLMITIRPTHSLTIDNIYLYNRIHDPVTSSSIFNNHIFRTKWNYQINKKLSVRMILQYDALLTNSNFTELRPIKNLNADFLVSYIVHHGTALFAGLNSNLQDLDPQSIPGLQPRDFINDRRQFFIKYSHLVRF